jgi:DtxR family Mn-dependent transcriptional regulator
MERIFVVLAALLLIGLALRLRLVSRILAARHAGRRIRMEDALKHVHAAELRGATATTASLGGALGLSAAAVVRLVREMEGAGLLESTGVGVGLTSDGRAAALQVIRAHRLLESYLADELSVPLEALHGEADRREHGLRPDEVDALESRLGFPARDPHGDPIPTAGGELREEKASSLVSWPAGRPGRIVHVEDEPSELFAGIVAAGLRPGMNVEILESTPSQVVLWDGARDYVLSRLAAASIDVVPLPQPLRAPLSLSGLEPGASVRVVGLDCQGSTRRRLLDLGLTPGAVVDCCFPAPLGQPVAYRVRGALLALRREQAERIRVERIEGDSGGAP